MATSEENKPAGITTELANAKIRTDLFCSKQSSQHAIFADIVKNRGAFIQPIEEPESKYVCDRCLAHVRKSLTDLRALPTRDRNNNDCHDPSCSNKKDPPSSRLPRSKQRTINDAKRLSNTERSSKTMLISQEQQSIVPLPRSAQSKSRIPVRISNARSSLSSISYTTGKKEVINNRGSSGNKKSMVHQTNNNKDELDDSDNDTDDNILTRKLKTTAIGADALHLNQTAANNNNKNVMMPSDNFDTITVHFRPTNINYEVRVSQNMTVRDVIIDVCRQADMCIEDDYYLWFDLRELPINNTVFEEGLYQASKIKKSLPEVRLKYAQLLRTSSHIGKHVFLTSSEEISYNEILHIPLPPKKKHIMPDILKDIAEQIDQHSSSASPLTHEYGTILIPLPIFSKQLIDSFPTINVKIPLSPDQFDWNVLLKCLADDLEIDRTDLIIVNARKGSTLWTIKLRSKLALFKDTVKKIKNKLLFMVLPKCTEFLTKHIISKESKIEVELEEFAKEKSVKDKSSFSPEELDLALRFCERPAIINKDGWKFMINKSRQISTCIIQSFQSCSDEYVIDHASIVYNEHIYDKYHNLATIQGEERVLFHGTNTMNFDGIFEKNFQYYSDAKRTDSGWYGQGIYFSSSPKKALNYAKSKSKISYLICCVVRLGKTLTVRDMRYKGKPMHPDYDSHHIPITLDGEPVCENENPAYEEFVIKKSDQIMPLYIVGLIKVSCFVIWRDAKITNEANSNLFEEMKQQYAFNIYASQTSDEALNILQVKLVNEYMNCVVVTNGADDGENFVRQCLRIRSPLPIIVYCQNTSYHQQWASNISESRIHVTSSPNQVFDFITNTLQK